MEEQIPQIFQNSGIRMMFKDEVYSVFASEEKEEVYGVLVCHEDGFEDDDFDAKPIIYFSVALKENCRKQNIATKLIENFIRSHKRTILKAKVWNPVLYGVLNRFGFVEEENLSTHPDHPIKLLVRR